MFYRRLMWVAYHALAPLAAMLACHCLITPACARTTGQPLGDVPVIGSRNTMTADPPVSRPTTVPLRVPLYQDLAFADFTPKAFTYHPPTVMHRRWAKVIFVADFSVNAGIQFDRTCRVSIGSVNVYYGTTAEPRPSVGPTWHVERDITDYSALLRTPQPGIVDLGNTVNNHYTGLITGSAYLLFYPEDRANPAPVTPDMALPIPNTPDGVQDLKSSSDLLSETFTFPTNITRACLDLVTESQIGDEFWYLSAPDDLAAKLQTSGGTAFRETEIRVDGAPAGVAPVYPWIYTGGIDPRLWSPIPGVQTLNFVPYRVDLTPFAARFSDGKPHTITIQLFNSHNYFSVAGTLLLYQDHYSKTVTGKLTEDDLTVEPDPNVSSHLVTNSRGDVSGRVSVLSDRHFTIAGYVNTSRGKIMTVVHQNVDFSSLQNFDNTAKQQTQSVRQIADVRSETSTALGAQSSAQSESFHYSLFFDAHSCADSQKAGLQTISARQAYDVNRTLQRNGKTIHTSALSDWVQSSDTVHNHPKPNTPAHTGLKSSSEYRYVEASGAYYDRKLSSANGILTSVTTKQNKTDDAAIWSTDAFSAGVK